MRFFYLRLAFYGIFALFNASFVAYNCLTGFDLSKIALPLILAVICGRLTWSIWKEKAQSSSDS